MEEPGGRASCLVVDFGGVLTTNIFESFTRWCEEQGVDPKRLFDALRSAVEPTAEHPLHLLETGRIETDEFDRHLAEVLSDGNDPIEGEGLSSKLFAHVESEPHMVEVVRSYHEQGITTGLLSNSWGRHGYPTELFDEIFDAVVISGEVGMRKPDPDIYEHTAKLLGREPAGCVFVDDLKHNVEGAEAVGMIGVHHTDPAKTAAELKEIFGR